MAATIREELRDALRGPSQTAFELSQAHHQSEKEILAHLEHLRRSLPRQDLRLDITPARCIACDFTFETRDRLSRPSRCPRCRAERIEPPRFRVVDA